MVFAHVSSNCLFIILDLDQYVPFFSILFFMLSDCKGIKLRDNRTYGSVKFDTQVPAYCAW